MKLHEFATLAEAQAYSVIVARMMSPDMMVAFLASAEIFRAVVAEDSEPAAALRAALQFGSEFNFMDGHPASVLSLLKKMACATPEFEATCVTYANPETFPFINTTQSQFSSAKGLFASQSISYIQGKDIIVTLNANLSERVSATTWCVETGFNPENAGRSVFVESENKYRINMSGKKSGDYEIRIPLLDADFTVELN